MSEVKKKKWGIDVRRDYVVTVTFDEDVSAKEAIERYMQQEYDDLPEEELHGEEALRAT